MYRCVLCLRALSRSAPFAASMLAACLFAALPMQASADKLADFPLRVHIFQRTEHTHYFRGVLDWVEGDGRANLFEDSQPRGFDFEFHCGDRLMTSSGFETYPARWKKNGRTLEILYPVMGKPGATHSCELKVNMKDFAYFRRQGNLETEPTAAFRQWMERHDYDPEHGKNEPINREPRPPYQGAAPEPQP